jgi:hypothetical protein
MKKVEMDLTKFAQNPIIQFNHDYSQPPIGKVEFQNNKVTFSFNEDFKITPKQLTRIEPSYIINKIDDDGNVTECELIELSIGL